MNSNFEETKNYLNKTRRPEVRENDLKKSIKIIFMRQENCFSVFICLL